MGRAAKALIDLAAIRTNYLYAKSLAGGARAVAVIKADAYGHGAARVAQAIEPGVDAFGVACIEEALELRAGGIQKPVLLLEGFFSPDELPIIAEKNFWIAIHSREQIAQLSAAELPAPVTIWLKMDSGMHRLGLAAQHYRQAYQQLRALAQVKEIVLMSHLACADELNSPHAQAQIDCFDYTTAGLQAPHSLANSPATLGWEGLHRQWIRPGLMLYGASPFAKAHPAASALLPAMSLVSEVIAVRDLAPGEAVGYAASFVCQRPMRVGTVAMGYGDGYSRHGGTGTPVLVAGCRTQVIGRVSMDMCSVDLTHIPAAGLGSPVEFWGTGLSINEVASHCETIPYTLLTGVTRRVVRVYQDS